VCYRLTVIRLN